MESHCEVTSIRSSIHKSLLAKRLLKIEKVNVKLANPFSAILFRRLQLSRGSLPSC